jgi:serine phosphatase RsbU (regulator of sigma subunit)
VRSIGLNFLFFWIIVIANFTISNAASDTARINQMLRSAKSDVLTSRQAAIGIAQKAYVLSNQEGYYKGMFNAYMQLGVIEHFYNSRYDKALGYYLKALNLATEAGDTIDKITSGTRAGTIYVRQKMKKEAFGYLSSAYYASKICNNDATKAFVISRLGFYYAYVENKHDLAIQYNLKAIKQLNNKPYNEYGYLYLSLASSYSEAGNQIASERYADKALQEFIKTDDKVYLAYMFTYLSRRELKKNNVDEAYNYANQGCAIALKYNLNKELIDAHDALYEVYKIKKDEHKALLSLETANALKDSFFSTSASAKIVSVGNKEMVANYESVLDVMSQENEAIKQQKNLVLILLALGGLVLLVSILFAVNKVKSNKELSSKNNIINQQREEVVHKNKEIIDSINYAQRIQNALLPSVNELTQLFGKNYFVLMQPRDIVSGDFFWMAQIDTIKYFAVADCTGHGVPGSFMSVLGNTILNELVTIAGVKEPAEILNKLRDRIIKDLKQTDNPDANRDGMDIALCAYNTVTNELKFAGANNEIYVLKRNTESFDDPELLRLKANKMPIGIYHGALKPFTQQSIQVQRGDAVYLFSDGYLDQFGGPKGRKFKHSRFGELLNNISELPINEQGIMVVETFEKWKGITEQLDDVLVLGLEL